MGALLRGPFRCHVTSALSWLPVAMRVLGHDVCLSPEDTHATEVL